MYLVCCCLLDLIKQKGHHHRAPEAYRHPPADSTLRPGLSDHVAGATARSGGWPQAGAPGVATATAGWGFKGRSQVRSSYEQL